MNKILDSMIEVEDYGVIRLREEMMYVSKELRKNLRYIDKSFVECSMKNESYAELHAQWEELVEKHLPGIYDFGELTKAEQIWYGNNKKKIEAFRVMRLDNISDNSIDAVRSMEDMAGLRVKNYRESAALREEKYQRGEISWLLEVAYGYLTIFRILVGKIVPAIEAYESVKGEPGLFMKVWEKKSRIKDSD